jgi:hypothetical protein
MPHLSLSTIKSFDGMLLRLVPAPDGRTLEVWDGSAWRQPVVDSGLKAADWLRSPVATLDDLRFAGLYGSLPPSSQCEAWPAPPRYDRPVERCPMGASFIRDGRRVCMLHKIAKKVAFDAETAARLRER